MQRAVLGVKEKEDVQMSEVLVIDPADYGFEKLITYQVD